MFLKLCCLFFVCFTYECAALVSSRCQEVNSTMAASDISVSACATYNGKVYWVIETKLYYDQALAACQKFVNGNTASIHSLEEYKFVYYLAGFFEPGAFYDRTDNVWIGLAKPNNDCSMPFQWSDGTPFDYENWNSGEPNCDLNNEYCTELVNWGDSVQSCPRRKTLQPAYGWNDLPCTGARQMRTICSA